MRLRVARKLAGWVANNNNYRHGSMSVAQERLYQSWGRFRDLRNKKAHRDLCRGNVCGYFEPGSCAAGGS